MTGSGRPLRFLVGLLGLWVGIRVVQLWPATHEARIASIPVAASHAIGVPRAPEAVASGRAAHGLVPRMAAEAMRVSGRVSQGVVQGLTGGVTQGLTGRWRRPAAMAGAARRPASAMLAAIATPAILPEMAWASARPAAAAGQDAPTLRTMPPPPIAGAPLAGPPTGARLRGSGWMIVRNGQAEPFVPQLGGSQAGVRLTYLVERAARLSLAGRLSTALGGRQREAAIGLDWQPTRLPVHVVAEQRIGIEQARGGPSLGLVGGFGPVEIAEKVRLDGYGQAGVIARDGAEAFGDGAVRVSRPMARIGPAVLELGAGAWGAAQRGAARFDVGPFASAVLPVGGANLRLAVEWRERLAGDAAPRSGPAVSIGTDF